MLCHSTQREERTLPVGVFDQADEEANSTQHRVRSTEYKARSTQHREKRALCQLVSLISPMKVRLNARLKDMKARMLEE